MSHLNSSSVILTCVNHLATSTQFKKSSYVFQLNSVSDIRCTLTCALISKCLFRTHIFNLHFVKHCTFTNVLTVHYCEHGFLFYGWFEYSPKLKMTIKALYFIHLKRTKWCWLKMLILTQNTVKALFWFHIVIVCLMFNLQPIYIMILSSSKNIHWEFKEFIFCVLPLYVAFDKHCLISLLKFVNSI